MTAPDLHRLRFHEVDRARWPHLERLFEARGGLKSCWCMVWRAQGTETRHRDGKHRKQGLQRRVEAGVPVGLLAYLGSEPVAWCSIAPRETYRRLTEEDAPDDAPGSVWSLVCFYVPRALRGLGMTRRLIDAAIATARRHGAEVLEAYPVDPDSPSYRFMGFVETFTSAGFREVGRAGARRHVLRLEL